MNFVAVDVETANADMASLCQIGIPRFENGALTQEWKTYIDPEDWFDPINVSIHGIDETLVQGAPTFPAVTDTLGSYFTDQVVVCHTHFDRVAIHQAALKYNTEAPECTWLDSARVARRTWTECAWRGYGLHDVCRMIGHEFKHHDALEDAKAAAQILLTAAEKTGLGIDAWLRRVRQPIGPETSALRRTVKRGGNPEGALSGEIVVFTGALQLRRTETADLAAYVGCQVDSGVTKRTTLLVVGDQHIKKLAGHDKSAKHRKAEELIGKGYSIRILRETDFQDLVRLAEEA